MSDREIMERILKAWQHFPHLRLGQFLENAVGSLVHLGKPELFYISNVGLAAACEEYVKVHFNRSQ